jgi:hypothetical protein
MMRVLSGFDEKDPYAREAIDLWFVGAESFCRDYNIPILDLFYWEQRMGHWGSQYPQEQDIAIEELSPFNNRNLLLSLLRVPSSERASPDYSFFRKLIGELWPEALAEPINPGNAGDYLKSVVKRHSVTRYYASILKSTLFDKPASIPTRNPIRCRS